eukprot:UN0595
MAASQAMADGELRDTRLVEEYFGSLWHSTLTLFMATTGGIDWQYGWNAIVTTEQAFWAALFLFYIAVSHMAILNVITGVVCQTAMESAEQDQDLVVESQLAMKHRYIEQLKSIFRDLDADRSGVITLQEFEERMEDEAFVAYFSSLDLTTDQAWSLFKLLDVNEMSMIDVDEFVSGCLKLRGAARSIDMHMLLYQNRWTMQKVAKIMAAIEDRCRHGLPRSAPQGTPDVRRPQSRDSQEADVSRCPPTLDDNSFRI